MRALFERSVSLFVEQNPSATVASQRKAKMKAELEGGGGVTRGMKRMAEEEKRTLFPLLSMMTHLPGVFVKEVIWRLNGTDSKFFARANKRCRDAVRRAKKDEEAEKTLEFKIWELSSISTLEWAWEEGFPFDESDWGRKKEGFIAYVAKGGKVDLLRWLREEKNCPWDSLTCFMAAKCGQLVCLQYAHENGCPLDEKTFGNERIEEYLSLLRL